MNTQVSIPASERANDSAFRVPENVPNDILTVDDTETYTVEDNTTDTYSLGRNDGTIQLDGTLQLTGDYTGYLVENTNIQSSKTWYVHISNGYDVNVDIDLHGR